MPLHIFLSTWVGTTFGGLEVAKVAKDVVLIVGFALALLASLRQPWLPTLLRSTLVGLVVAYIVFTLVTLGVLSVQWDAELLGFVYNVRFLIFFLYALLIVRLFAARHILQRSLQIVLTVGAMVALFGVVQYTVLPDDALTNIGYSRENGVLPAFHIDDKPDLERAMATLRDPNSLGSYLIITSSLFAAALLAARSYRMRILLVSGLALSLLCLYFTFSRSAWLGAALAAMVFVGAAALTQGRVRDYLRSHGQTLLSLLLVIVSLGIVTAVAAKDSYFVQNVIFHADSSTTLEDPNELRLRFWDETVSAVQERPFGHGVGTAGLASIRNSEQGTVLTENYYLQILYEIGIVGLFLFLAILAYLAYHLIATYVRSKNLYVLALIAAFTGLLFTNFLVHIWANEAVAYTFWGLVGLCLTSLLAKQLSPKRT